VEGRREKKKKKNVVIIEGGGFTLSHWNFTRFGKGL